MSEQESQLIGAHLSPVQVREFEVIQEFYGIKSKSDTLRFVIRQEARRINVQVPCESPSQE
jgi:hypothetical protein